MRPTTVAPLKLRFSLTPFYVTRQFYFALERGIIEPDGVELQFEYNHSPAKDHVLICGAVDASTISLGKYVLAKTISDTYTIPTDPLAIAASLTYERGNGLFVHANAAIHHPQDLVGARLGIHDKSLALTYHKAILEDVYDVPVDEIEWVFDTHQGLTDRMDAGDIDCVERVGDWYWNLKASSDHEMLYDMAEQWHELQGYYPIVHLVAVDRNLYDTETAAMDSFLEALQQSTAYRDEQYDSIIQAFATEDDTHSEWTGERSVDDLTTITSGARCPFRLDEPQRENFRDWMSYAVRYGVLSEPVADERLFPD